MYCKNCGEKQEEGAKFCLYCGNELYKEVGIEANEPTKNSALVCGILSLFFFGLILGIIAVVLANDPQQKSAKAARVLGIIGIVGWAILIALQLSGAFSS